VEHGDVIVDLARREPVFGDFRYPLRRLPSPVIEIRTGPSSHNSADTEDGPTLSGQLIRRRQLGAAIQDCGNLPGALPDLTAGKYIAY
jgi:hypothetical protein